MMRDDRSAIGPDPHVSQIAPGLVWLRRVVVWTLTAALVWAWGGSWVRSVRAEPLEFTSVAWLVAWGATSVMVILQAVRTRWPVLIVAAATLWLPGYATPSDAWSWFLFLSLAAVVAVAAAAGTGWGDRCWLPWSGGGTQLGSLERGGPGRPPQGVARRRPTVSGSRQDQQERR